MESFDTFFGLKLGVLVFSLAEMFSSNLQAKNITVQEATAGADLLISRMKSLRRFSLFYDEVQKESSILTKEPTLPRYRKLPKRYDNGASPHQYQSPNDRYRQSYFEVLEIVAGEIERRFNQPGLEIIKSIEQLLIKASNDEQFEM